MHSAKINQIVLLLLLHFSHFLIFFMARYQPIENEATKDSSVYSVPVSFSNFSGDNDGPFLEDHRPLLSHSSATTSLYQSDDPVSEDVYNDQYATATPVSCSVNLVNTILGTGLLAMVG